MDVSSEFGKVVTRLTQHSEENFATSDFNIVRFEKVFLTLTKKITWIFIQRISWQLYVSYISTFQKMNDEVDDPENEIHLVSLNAKCDYLYRESTV